MLKAVQSAVFALRAAGIDTLVNEPMNRHTSFRIGGPASVFCIPESIGQLVKTIETVRDSGLFCFFLGKGSNVIFYDEGYCGVVIHIGRALGKVTVLDSINGTLAAGAGAYLSDLCEAAKKASLTGFEFAYGIPGSVGGAVYMNAGAYGGEVRDVLHSVTYLDENLRVITAEKNTLEFGYRRSVFQKKVSCVLSATFRLKAGEQGTVAALMAQNMWQRRQKQPLELPSAGSAFKRPKGAYAGALIDKCGLRGRRVGGAAVSEKHCGFIVNLGNASCSDVLRLAEEITEQVREKTGYLLEKEIRIVSPNEGYTFRGECP